MNEHDATEIAFKNGYEKAVKDIFAEIESFIGEKYESYVFDDIDMKDWEQDAIVAFADTMSEHFAELKKKYMEEKK